MAEGSSPRRPLIVAAVLVALVAGAALVVVLTGGDDEERPAGSPETQARTTQTTEVPRTNTAPSESGTGGRTDPTPGDTPATRRNARGITAAVVGLVRASEEGDGARVCSLLGRPGSNGPGCASSAGIDLARLPTSDELSFERARSAGPRATVVLVGGTRVSLRRQGSRWLVTGWRPGIAPQP